MEYGADKNVQHASLKRCKTAGEYNDKEQFVLVNSSTPGKFLLRVEQKKERVLQSIALDIRHPSKNEQKKIKGEIIAESIRKSFNANFSEFLKERKSSVGVHTRNNAGNLIYSDNGFLNFRINQAALRRTQTHQQSRNPRRASQHCFPVKFNNSHYPISGNNSLLNSKEQIKAIILHHKIPIEKDTHTQTLDNNYRESGSEAITPRGGEDVVKSFLQNHPYGKEKSRSLRHKTSSSLNSYQKENNISFSSSEKCESHYISHIARIRKKRMKNIYKSVLYKAGSENARQFYNDYFQNHGDIINVIKLEQRMKKPDSKPDWTHKNSGKSWVRIKRKQSNPSPQEKRERSKKYGRWYIPPNDYNLML